jgi:excisionase family DNA binding protein
MSKLLSIHAAAERLGVSTWTVARLARAGRLASIRLGRRTLFAEEDLEDLIRRNHRETVSPRSQG